MDPRAEVEAFTRPFERAVNIPLDELPVRTHELPPKHEAIAVIGEGPLAAEAIAFLQSLGRRAEYAGEGRPAAYPQTGRLWSPNQFLSSLLPSLSPGLALDIGCGSGRDAVFMAAHRWRVHGIDHLPDAISKAEGLAARYLNDMPARPRFEVADVSRFEVTKAYDLIACFFYFDASVARALTGWLKPGGTLLVEHFTPMHKKLYGRPKTDLLDAEQLAELFAPLDLQHYEEGEHDGRFTFRLCCTAPF